jgi:putative transposase
LNSALRKILKGRVAFPNDEAVFKLVSLSLRSITKRWSMPIQDWKAALNRFASLFADRIPLR